MEKGGSGEIEIHLIADQLHVLILVLMEKGGSPTGTHYDFIHTCVLILVLMEKGGSTYEAMSFLGLEDCLNPCFDGKRRINKNMKVKIGLLTQVLILVLMEKGGSALKSMRYKNG